MAGVEYTLSIKAAGYNWTMNGEHPDPRFRPSLADSDPSVAIDCAKGLADVQSPRDFVGLKHR